MEEATAIKTGIYGLLFALTGLYTIVSLFFYSKTINTRRIIGINIIVMLVFYGISYLKTGFLTGVEQICLALAIVVLIVNYLVKEK